MGRGALKDILLKGEIGWLAYSFLKPKIDIHSVQKETQIKSLALSGEHSRCQAGIYIDTRRVVDSVRLHCCALTIERTCLPIA